MLTDYCNSAKLMYRIKKVFLGSHSGDALTFTVDGKYVVLESPRFRSFHTVPRLSLYGGCVGDRVS